MDPLQTKGWLCDITLLLIPLFLPVSGFYLFLDVITEMTLLYNMLITTTKQGRAVTESFT